jgi:hypothetical protein
MALQRQLPAKAGANAAIRNACLHIARPARQFGIPDGIRWANRQIDVGVTPCR